MARYDDFIDAYLDAKTTNSPNAVAVCLFHDDTSPSMSVHRESGLFLCWACGAKGNISRLAKQLGMVVKANGFVPALDDPEADMTAFLKLLDDENDPPAELVTLPETWLSRFAVDYRGSYWKKRGFALTTVRAWQLGYDSFPDHATIPIRDEAGSLVGVIRRQLAKGAKPKYLNPKGFVSRMSLFGAWMVPDGCTRVVLVEGPLDAVRVWEAGHPAVAIMGSRMSERQVTALLRMGIEEVVMFFDNDEPGFVIATDALPLLHEHFQLDAATYGYGVPDDPGAMSLEQVNDAIRTSVALNYERFVDEVRSGTKLRRHLKRK